jgi:3-phosphoshikimate 1-carboxyvinyltransferase
VGLRGLRPPARDLDAGNSGTGMRLLAGLLAGQQGHFTLDGDDSLRRRPMDRIVAPLRNMGAAIAAREDRYPPLEIDGASLHGIAYELPVASAQVKSCLLLAGLLADGVTSVREPVPSRDHTERLLLAAGAALTTAGGEVRVTPGSSLALERLSVPGDASSAAFLVAAALLIPGSYLEIDDVGLNPTRTGFFEVARRMGGEVDWTVESQEDGEPRGRVVVEGSQLTGTTVVAEEVPSLIDELPLVALLGCFAAGETEIGGAGELRVKESDRLTGIVEIIIALGGRAEVEGDTLVVWERPLRGGVVETRGDHRLALLGAVAELVSREGVRVRGFEAAEVSFPGFVDALGEVLER